jgi:hypothetical protein
VEINEQLGEFQDRALKTSTHLAQLLLSRGTLQEHNNVQAYRQGVSSKTAQRTIRELVSNLTTEIFLRLEGPQMGVHNKLLSRLESVLETIETHLKDHARLDAAKAVHRTVAVQQLNVTSAQLTETYECARETTHYLESLANQLERVVDSLHQSSPPVVTTPSVNFDNTSHQVLPFRRLRSRFPDNLQTVMMEVQKVTKEDLFARRRLHEVTTESERIRMSLFHVTAALNLIKGQANSEDEELDIPTVTYSEENNPLASESQPQG